MKTEELLRTARQHKKQPKIILAAMEELSELVLTDHRVRATFDKRKEIERHSKEGASVAEIVYETGLSAPTVRKVIRQQETAR